MKSKRFYYVFLILVVLLIIFFLSPQTWMNADGPTSSQSGKGSTPSPKHSSASAAAGAKGAQQAASKNAANTAELSTSIEPKPNTSASRRSIPTAKKPIKDILASWEIQSPWPEGPRLMVDVESSDTRYVNLRPNEQGIMPRLHVKALETLQVTLSMPESNPGETIFLELPNGGTFPDQELRGKTLLVGENKTINFTMSVSAMRGHCTISIRQAGHTRTLPLWVGAPLSPPRDEIADPNRPTS